MKGPNLLVFSPVVLLRPSCWPMPGAGRCLWVCIAIFPTGRKRAYRAPGNGMRQLAPHPQLARGASLSDRSARAATRATPVGSPTALPRVTT